MAHKEVRLMKPNYIGMCILDISKIFMYKFHYEKVVSDYGNRAKLLMTDTDSLIYHIKTPDVYADMLKDINMYDTSDYPRDHPAYSSKKFKTLGKMKDEMNSIIIKQFVGLRPKMYSIKDANKDEKKTAKGISKRCTAKMRHQSYLDALYEEKPLLRLCSRLERVVTMCIWCK